MSVATPTVWVVTLLGFALLLLLDFAITRRPHEVSQREALGWSAFYLALPLLFTGWVWSRYGAEPGTEFLAGYLVEKSLSVDNLFVFMILLAAFAVPPALQQRVLLWGILGALALRGVFIALGAIALSSLSAAFAVFGLILLITAVKVAREARHGQAEVDIEHLRSLRLLRRLLPITRNYHGPALVVREQGRRHLTPLAAAVTAVLATDLVFAVDSVPAVFGITSDPYLVFATNAFALLGLRALYFLLAGLLHRLVHLGYGLAAILALIGVKLLLHWAHTLWPSVPQIPTGISLAGILVILTVVTVTSLRASRTQTRAVESD